MCFFTSLFPLCARALVYFLLVDINTMPKHNHSLWQTQRIINIKITWFPPGEQSVPVTFQTRSLSLSASFSLSFGLMSLSFPRSLNLSLSHLLACGWPKQDAQWHKHYVHSRVWKWSSTHKKRKQQSLSCVNIFLLKYSLGHIVSSASHDDNVAKAAGKKGE